MGLQEEVEELTKQVAEAEKAESGDAGGEVEQEEKEVVEEPKTADTEEDGDTTDEPADKAEEKPVEKVAEKTEELDASGYARLRRELAAERKARQELEARVAAPVIAPAVVTPAAQVQAEPDKAKDPVAWFTWRDAQREQEIKELKSWKETVSQQTAEVQLETEAVREFKTIEAEFKASNPDFDHVADHFNNKLAQSIAMLEPNLSQEQVMVKVKDRVLRMAGEYVRQGLNPVEELYHLSKERYGYTAPVQEDAEEEPAPKKPDLSKVAANRKRNAGTAAAKGAGSMPQLTREVAADMPVHEWAALSADEKRRLLSAE